MKEKIMATLMASIMVVVALAAFVAPAQAADPEGASSNPKYIIGDASTPYELGTEGTVKAKIDFNYSAYDSLTNLVFTAHVDGQTTTPVTLSGTAQTVGNVKIAISGTNGLQTVTVTGETAAAAAQKIIIELGVTDTVWTGTNARSVDLDYFYALNIKVVTAASAGLILTDGTNDITEATADTKPLDIQLGKDFGGWSANVSSNNVKYNYTKYDFYTTGLPAGIYMKSTGEIAGKVISTATVTAAPVAFYVFAVDIATGEKILDGKFYYKISLASDSFMYEIDDGDDDNTPVYVAYDVVGYTAIRNYDTTSIKVNVVDTSKQAINLSTATNYEIKYTVSNDSGTAVAKDVASANRGNGFFTIPITEFSKYTGVVEITIEDTTNHYKAIIHTMVVGPVVHSGLAPTVTSA